MSSSKVFTQAICLRQSDWSETSQIATLLTSEHGIVRGIAKGSRRWNAPFSGGLEVLTRGQVALFLKPARELQLISEWDLQETFPAGRHHWRVHCAQLLATEVALRLVPAGPESVPSFQSLLGFLRRLESQAARPGPTWWLAVYVWRMLEHAGHAPDLTTAPTGATTAGDVAQFAPELGRWLAPRERFGTTWAMRSETLAVLQQIAQAPDDATTLDPDSTASLTDNPLANRPHAELRTIERAGRFLIAFLEYVSGQEIRTAGSVFSDNPI